MVSFLYKLFFGNHSSSPELSDLELLSDELLLEILSYVSIPDLFYGWLNLNWRFNVILHNLPIRKFYNESKSSWWQQWWEAWRDYSDEKPLRYFALQLVCLQTHNHFTSFFVNKINVLNYPNLRILKLHQPTPIQLDAIRQDNFRHLEYLSLAETRNFSFEILCQFKSLRSCELMSLKIDDTLSCSSSSIRSLILHNCKLLSFVYLLRHLPQMTFFQVVICWRYSSVDKSGSTTLFVHPNLMSLNITILNCDRSNDKTNAENGCAAVLALLKHVSPNIGARCRLYMLRMTNFNFEQLQRTVFELNFTHFSCQLWYDIRCHSLPNFAHIRQLPLFSRLKPIITFLDVAVIYRSTWTNCLHKKYMHI